MLLYGSECWTPLSKHLRKLDTFHHRCLRAILGVSCKQQWDQHISSRALRQRWGDVELISRKVMRRRLEWLGHTARMPEHRIPKLMLFGWLPQPRPPGGPRRRWRDLIRRVLKAVGVREDRWFDDATESRAGWRTTYQRGMEEEPTQEQVTDQPPRHQPIRCDVCTRGFRRARDMARHKCIDERQNPISEQKGAVQSQSYHT